MTNSVTEKTEVRELEKEKVYYKEYKILGGLIRWTTKIKTKSMGKDLLITTEENYDSIYLNGKLIFNQDFNDKK